MSENQDTLDGGTPNNGALPSFLNVWTILTFIGKGIMALLYLIGAFATGTLASLMGAGGGGMDRMQEAMAEMEGMEGVDAAELNEAMEVMDSAGGFLAMGSGVIMAVFLVLTICAILCIVGAARMRKLRKSGFSLYMIGNGIILLTSIWMVTTGFGGWLAPIVYIGFIIGYVVNRKHLVNA